MKFTANLIASPDPQGSIAERMLVDDDIIYDALVSVVWGMASAYTVVLPHKVYITLKADEARFNALVDKLDTQSITLNIDQLQSVVRLSDSHMPEENPRFDHVVAIGCSIGVSENRVTRIPTGVRTWCWHNPTKHEVLYHRLYQRVEGTSLHLYEQDIRRIEPLVGHVMRCVYMPMVDRCKDVEMSEDSIVRRTTVLIEPDQIIKRGGPPRAL